MFERPISCAVKGPSSGGKSHVVEQVLRFFPAESHYSLSGMSGRSTSSFAVTMRHTTFGTPTSRLKSRTDNFPARLRNLPGMPEPEEVKDETKALQKSEKDLDWWPPMVRGPALWLLRPQHSNGLAHGVWLAVRLTGYRLYQHGQALPVLRRR
jgi:hypothetical protein